MSQDYIEVALTEDRIDVGIVFSRPLQNGGRAGEFATKKLFEETLCVAVSNAHPLAGQQEPMSVQEFQQEALVVLNTHFALRRHIDRYCLDHDIAPHIAIETNSLNVIIEMIQVGRLATVLPSSIVATQCGLYPILLSPEMPSKAITMICRERGYKSPACRAFTELALYWSAHRSEETPIRKLRPFPLSEAYYKNTGRMSAVPTS
jgi:LysR family cyn operon transcriptional activator